MSQQRGKHSALKVAEGWSLLRTWRSAGWHATAYGTSALAADGQGMQHATEDTNWKT
jgi:hypothetical protein